MQGAIFTVSAWFDQLSFLSSKLKDAYSKMIFKVSADFTKPWYLTILGCCECHCQYLFLEPNPKASRAGLTSRFFNKSISSYRCKSQRYCLHRHARNCEHPPTMMTRSSLFGRSVSFICFTATVSPVFQFKAL